MPAAVRAVGLPGLLSGAFLAGQFFLFIASLTRTTVANTFVLMSVSPFLAALAARLFLREPVPARTWLAMAVALRPPMVIADEPTSMLDVSIRTGIMHLMFDLAQRLDVTYLYITHDLAVARYMCDRIAVMYLGKLVELINTF
jgi:ABC-type antimicrobial peptide transport system ATPase subunit